MRRTWLPYNGKRYLLNTNTMEVHDLDREISSCKINEISKEHIKMADSLEQLIVEAYVNDKPYDGCAYCMPEHHTK